MKTPKEKLKEIYDEYLSWKENNKGRHFYQYLTSNKFLFVYTTLEVIKELTTHCGFSTTSECRKAINELEKQEETTRNWTTWDDILVIISQFQSKMPHKEDLVDWLKENYYPPVKK